MIEIFKMSESGQGVVRTETIEKGCWINLIKPSEEELKYLQNELGILPNFLRDPLDDDERPRIDVEDGQTLIIVDTPVILHDEKGNEIFSTIPLGMLVLADHYITISSAENVVLDLFRNNKARGFYTYKKTRFTFQILFRIATDFLKHLRHIDKKTDEAEKQLHRSMRNKELFSLLDLEKSLVFFATSLKSNEMVMEKLLRGKYLKMYEEDQDLLEDVIIENKQAIEMANIYSTILSGMMDAFASIISNNLNVVMKFLTSVTIVMAIPTMIASFYGMNIELPFMHSPFAFLYIIILSLVMSIVVIYMLYKKRLF